eukprot:SAG31_NODE_4001_length_3676_cov_16.072127_3_plen_321_part_00
MGLTPAPARAANVDRAGNDRPQRNRTAMMIAFALVIAAAHMAGAEAEPLSRWDADADAAKETPAMPITASAEHVARAAQQLRGDATVEAALHAVRAGKRGDGPASETEAEAPAAAELALAALGFETALDLRLLAGGPEAAELMGELRTSGALSIADRAKIRLLVGDREHLARVVLTASLSQVEEPAGGRAQGGQAVPQTHRLLQEQGTASTLSAGRQLQDARDNSLSFDTIAIVFSVFIGVCGYLLQAWTADRAQRHAAELQREHDQEARTLQVEHDRTQAQIRRTERWVDDICTPIGRAMGEYSYARWRFGECRCTCCA